MDLPELLEPERIRCHCDIHSKKRALQTVAELLGAALRGDAPGGEPGADAAADPATPTSAAGAVPTGVIATDEAGGDGPEAPREEGVRRGLLGRKDREARKADAGREETRKGKEGRAGKRGAKSREEEPAGEVSDMDILDALISRERLGSTGLGHGVALPHSRLDLVDAPLAAMITLNDGVDFEAGDGEPVDLVLGLLVPRDCNDEHLKILANLARRFGDAELREALRGYSSGEELFAHLQRLAAAD